MGSVPDHHNKMNITIKQVTLKFCFLVHIKVMLTLYYNLLCAVALHLKNVYTLI